MNQDEAAASFGIVIMAAGKGTRLKSARPKVLHEVGGKALLLHVIDAALKVVPADAITVVVGHQAEMVRAAVQAASQTAGVRFVLQAEQRGTGHALQVVKAAYAGTSAPEHLLVLSGDVPLIRTETIAAMRDFHLEQQAEMTILTAIPADPTGYGRVVRKAEGPVEALAIVEQKSLKPEQLGLREINSGIYAFRTAALFRHLDQLTTDNAHGEYYLTDVARLMVEAGEKVVALAAQSVDEVLGANTIAEMMHLDAALRLETTKRLMANGVTIFRPETCVIDAEVEVGADTILEPFTQLLGKTKVGSFCRIRSYSVISNSTLSDHVLVRNGCVMEDSVVDEAALIGPYAHLRPGSQIGPRARVGNFVETKKVKLGAGSKANHLTYLGDAEIGEGTNIGAGVITCNYDGAHKNLTRIGDNAFIGSDSTLVAPITIEDGAYIAAGSAITEDVPSGALALGRSRQVIKEGWTARKKDK